MRQNKESLVIVFLSLYRDPVSAIASLYLGSGGDLKLVEFGFRWLYVQIGEELPFGRERDNFLLLGCIAHLLSTA